ncbi:MAG: hypothetical protein ACLFV5_06690 [Anaerolineales bacterium]
MQFIYHARSLYELAADELDVTFVVADNTLLWAANAEGFWTERPEDHTPA